MMQKTGTGNSSNPLRDVAGGLKSPNCYRRDCKSMSERNFLHIFVDSWCSSTWLNRARRAVPTGFILLAVLLAAACSGDESDSAESGLGNNPFGFEQFEAPSLDELVPGRLGPRPEGSIKTVVEHYMQQYQPNGSLPKLFETTRVYDRNGVLLAEFFEEGRRTWVTLDQISPALISATVATEDATFFTNRGVDSRRIVGAAIQNVQTQSIASGASTITMQLARNLFLEPEERFEQTIDRKFFEIGLAHDLTILFNKEELLEIYLNLVNYGHLAYGPEAAAQVYFGKSAIDLTWAEATILAGVPQQPASFDLFSNFNAAKQRQRVVLDLLVRHDFLTQERADAIFAEEIFLIGSSEEKDYLAPHFVLYVEKALERRMAEALGIENGRWKMRRSGMHIITSLDMPMQVLAEQELKAWIARVGEAYRMTNGALVAIQPQTGEILAMVGGVDFNQEDAGQVNLSVSLRQPGSSFKPVLYAAALSENLISPATVIWDTPTAYPVGMGHFYSPRNYDRTFHGPVTVRTALANSYNVPAVKLLASLGNERLVSKAKEFGITSLTREPGSYGLSLSLGAGEVSLLELTNAFRTFANEGLYSPPQFAMFMVDDLGRYRSPPPVEQKRIISEGVAFQLTDILSDNEARKPAFGANSRLKLSRPAAAKTGTTTNFKDNWTVGFTKYLVAGVWTGNSDGTPMWGNSGAAGAAPLWHNFMEAVIADKGMRELIGAPDDPNLWAFDVPDSVVQLPDCPPAVRCRTGGEYFTSSWLSKTRGNGLLAGTVVTGRSLPTHFARSADFEDLSYCIVDETIGAVNGGRTNTAPETRSLLRISSWVGLAFPPGYSTVGRPLAPMPEIKVDEDDDGLNTPPPEYRDDLVYIPATEQEKFRLLSYSMQRGIPVSLGSCSDLRYYTARANDSWAGLARAHGLPESVLRNANLHVKGSLNGERLLLPRAIPIRFHEESMIHEVESGDSWVNIAAKYDIPISLLRAANPNAIRPYYILRPGDLLHIPENLEIFQNPFE
ncbi:MAG: LysM peptidoglycan-binding domain-containing protein [Caldilineaceae bacterium SB0668_bin_21]|nr:LysM peptidoglycan-binding domain-containing protein [Caldilineaceae bacterium SB0668_bin_21]MYC23722.1 LysM peptidoglycan-binding domain-containing protein [Caldilineaceae bacterium SB0662_bin_25]